MGYDMVLYGYSVEFIRDKLVLMLFCWIKIWFYLIDVLLF